MDSYKIVKSNKRINDKVYFRGFEYLQDGESKSKTKTYYCCSLYKSLKCPGRLIRDLSKEDVQQFTVSKDHTHSADGALIPNVEVIQTLKRKAEESLEPARNVISKLNENLPVAVAATLPKTKAMPQMIRRRRINKDIPLPPTNLQDLVIPEKLKRIEDVLFMLYDSGPGPNRILIFATPRNLELLQLADVISMDGTFDIVPPLFTRLPFKIRTPQNEC